MKHTVAEEIMSSPVITVSPGTLFREIVSIMLAYTVSGLPVVDGKRRLLGIVTKADLLRNAEKPGPQPEVIQSYTPSLPPKRSAEWGGKVGGATAGDLMTKNVVTAGEDTPTYRLGHLMFSHRVNRLPILKDGVLVGIVTRTDILKAFQRSDRTVLIAIQEMVERDLWIEPKKLTIACLNGHVTVSGEVDRRSERDLTIRRIKAVDGVLDVNADRFEFLYDDLPLRGVVT